MFYRIETDGSRQKIDLANFYASSNASACWIIGGGVSLSELNIQEIRNSPIPKFSMNLAGSGLLRPDFWTSYDPTGRFHRSVYLDPSIIKFLHRSRAMDLVPESNHKVCDCPATLFFDRSRKNSFQNFFKTHDSAIPDWQDSFLQTIQIAFQLGFRRLYLGGCDLFIRPTQAQVELAVKHGVQYEPFELLRNFFQRCTQAGIKKEDLEAVNKGSQYHFNESKSLDATIQTDFHYFRVAQYLRLARKSLATAGLRLITVTPRSRLNDYFPFQTVESAVEQLHNEVGNPFIERTEGLYTGECQRPRVVNGPMRDFKPHFSEAIQNQMPQKPKRNQVIELPEIPVYLNENP